VKRSNRAARASKAGAHLPARRGGAGRLAPDGLSHERESGWGFSHGRRTAASEDALVAHPVSWGIGECALDARASGQTDEAQSRHRGRNLLVEVSDDAGKTDKLSRTISSSSRPRLRASASGSA
jgi:hypothetical protein